MATGKLIVAWTMRGGSGVGQDVTADERGVARPEGARRQHELAVAELEEARPGEPGEHGQERHADRHHADADARPEHRGDQERGEDGREALDGVHQPHEALVEPAAEVAGQHRRAATPIPMPIPTAITPTRMEVTAPRHDAGEQVAPELVGAERVRFRRTLEAAA